MSITAITIENFKGIKEPVRIELKPITLLFGPNSAGKSTIIQALHYAHEIFERQNLNPNRTLLGGDTIDLGGFKSLVHQHDLKLPIRIRVDLDLSNEDLPYYDEVYEKYGSTINGGEDSYLIWQIPAADVRTAWVEITVRWSSLLNQPLLTSYQVGINGEKLATIERAEDSKQVNLTQLDLLNPVFLGKSSQDLARQSALKLLQGEDLTDEENEAIIVFTRFKDLINTTCDESGITKDIALVSQNSAIPNWGAPLKFDKAMWNRPFSDEDEGDCIQVLSKLITGPGELVREGLLKLCYVGPLREVPSRNHHPSTYLEESRWANGLAAYDTLFFSDDAFIDRVNEWLTQKERLDSGYSVEVKKYRELETDNPLMLAILQGRILDEDINLSNSLLALPVERRLLFRDEARNIELAPQDIGVGISQVLPVVVAALHHRTGLVAIEQPELHIHPAFQVALGDLFIKQVRECPDLTFILETHSEHLLLRIMRRIRQTAAGELPDGIPKIRPEDVMVLFVETDGSRSIVREMPLNEYGDLVKAWPGGFFEEDFEELF